VAEPSYRARAFPAGVLSQGRRRPSRPRSRVPGAAGPELPGSLVPPRRSPGQARGRPGPLSVPPDPRGCCTGYGGRDGGRSLAPGRCEAGRAGVWAGAMGWGGVAAKAILRAGGVAGGVEGQGYQGFLWKPGEQEGPGGCSGRWGGGRWELGMGSPRSREHAGEREEAPRMAKQRCQYHL
jgi:hypothetical protein